MGEFMRNIYLFRHGQTDWNVKGMMQGHRDIPLNNIGLGQAQLLQTKLSNLLCDRMKVYSSDLLRALKTCQIALPGHDINIDQDLREIFVGEHEGKSIHDLNINFQDPSPHFRFPGGESIQEHSVRLLNFLTATLKVTDETLFISTHGGSMARILEQCRDYKHRKIENCDVAHISYEDDNFYFKKFI